MPKALDTGLAAAAQKNRQREARMLILQAFQRLGIPRDEWPDYVRAFSDTAHTCPEYNDDAIPATFQPPSHDRLNQSIDDWIKAADKAWEQYKREQIQQWDSWVKLGADEEIPKAKSTRGPGTKRRNEAVDARYEWAARRLQGLEWKQIAIDCGVQQSRVKKAAGWALLLAGWEGRRRQRPAVVKGK